MKPTIVEDWDLKDRGDGVELRVTFKDGSTRKLNFHDDDAEDLSTAVSEIVGSSARPVTEGEHVR